MPFTHQATIAFKPYNAQWQWITLTCTRCHRGLASFIAHADTKVAYKRTVYEKNFNLTMALFDCAENLHEKTEPVPRRKSGSESQETLW